jgi:hypothetical protein
MIGYETGAVQTYDRKPMADYGPAYYHRYPSNQDTSCPASYVVEDPIPKYCRSVQIIYHFLYGYF